MSLLTDVDAFSTEHRYRGDLDGGVDDLIVWLACECWGLVARRADERDHVGGD